MAAARSPEPQTSDRRHTSGRVRCRRASRLPADDRATVTAAAGSAAGRAPVRGTGSETSQAGNETKARRAPGQHRGGEHARRRAASGASGTSSMRPMARTIDERPPSTRRFTVIAPGVVHQFSDAFQIRVRDPGGPTLRATLRQPYARAVEEGLDERLQRRLARGMPRHGRHVDTEDPVPVLYMSFRLEDPAARTVNSPAFPARRP